MAMEIQLQIESARAQTAEQERSALIQTLVTTLCKSSGKGKRRKGPPASGKRNRSQDHRNNVKCWSCARTGHCSRDCRDNWSRDQSKGKGKGKPRRSSRSQRRFDLRSWSVIDGNQQHRKMLEQEPCEGHRKKSEKVAKTTRRKQH